MSNKHTIQKVLPVIKTQTRKFRATPFAYSVFILFLIFGWSLPLSGGEPAEQTRRQIQSQYRDPVDQTWRQTIQWFCVQDSRQRLIKIWADLSDKQPAYQLTYTPDGLLSEVLDVSAGQSLNSQQPGAPIVLSWGHPFPYDDLNPGNTELTDVVVKKNAGGSVFGYKLNRSIEYLSLAEARSQGMISTDALLPAGIAATRLRLISIRQDARLMVRQLWADNMDWWLFEETPVRRSYLIRP